MMTCFKYIAVVGLGLLMSLGVDAQTYGTNVSQVGSQNAKLMNPVQKIIDNKEHSWQRKAEYNKQYSERTSDMNSDRLSEAKNVGRGDTGAMDGDEFGKSYAKLMELSSNHGERPMADITSTPAHIVIPTIQYRVHQKTIDEMLVNKQAKERWSLKYLSNKKLKGEPEYQECTGQDKKDLEKKGDEDLEIDANDKCKADEDESEEEEEEDEDEDEEEEEEDEDEELKLREIDARLSRIKLEIDEALESIKLGVVGEAEQMDEEVKSTSYELTKEEQKKVTSSAGTAKAKEAYANQRRYDEQEEAIRMMALAGMLRVNISSVNNAVDAVREHYEKSDAKRDLNKKCGVVKRSTDMNQALRQYIYYSLIYDQMLSIEQQIIGLRLQAKGGQAIQGVDVLSDSLKTKKK